MFSSTAGLAHYAWATSDSGLLMVIKILLELSHTHLLMHCLGLHLHYSHGVK